MRFQFVESWERVSVFIHHRSTSPEPTALHSDGGLLLYCASSQL